MTAPPAVEIRGCAAAANVANLRLVLRLGGMRRAEVLHVRGETTGKTPPPGASQSPLGASVAKIVSIFPCSWLRLLLRSLVIAGLDID